MVTVPLNLHSADLTSLPVTTLSFVPIQLPRVRLEETTTGHGNHGHSLSQYTDIKSQVGTYPGGQNRGQ